MNTVKDLIEALELEMLGGSEGLDKEINGVYIGDLLSWVMAHVQPGDAWITIQTHVNIIAVGVLGEVSCIIIPENAEVDEATITKANVEEIPLLRSSLNAYQLAIKLNQWEGLK